MVLDLTFQDLEQSARHSWEMLGAPWPNRRKGRLPNLLTECYRVWAVVFVTKPNLPSDRRTGTLVMATPLERSGGSATSWKLLSGQRRTRSVPKVRNGLETEKSSPRVQGKTDPRLHLNVYNMPFILWHNVCGRWDYECS